MTHHGMPAQKKLPLKTSMTLAVCTCLMTACSSAPKTLPSNTAIPVVATGAPQIWEAPKSVESTVATPIPPITVQSTSGLDDETLSVLNDLLEARDMSMVEGDRIVVERYGNLWDRVRRGYRLNQPSYNARIDAQKQWFGGKQDYLNRLTARASRYLHHTVTEAERRGIPTELALLPIIESSYDPSATSNASAAGLWQFIPSTGRIYGLSQSATYDGRRDVIESTRAAYDFLTSLYNQFGSWELALAAYNAGPGRISRAIEANQAQGLSTDYWSLRLPAETMSYVPRFMAVAQIVANPSAHGVSLPAIANHPHFRAVSVNTGISLQEVSAITDVPLYELQLLNPALTNLKVDLAAPSRVVIPESVPQTVDAKLSALSGYGYNANATPNTTYIRPETVANPSMESAQVLKQNNTLPTTKSAITPQNTIIQEPPLSKEERDFIANQIRQNTSGVEPINVQDGNIELKALQTGQSVLEAQGKTKSLSYGKSTSQRYEPPTASTSAYEPPTGGTSYQAPKPSHQPSVAVVGQATTHRVQSGDTLTDIANKYGVSVSELRQWNGMSVGDTLLAGKVLKLYDTGSSRPVQSSRPQPVVQKRSDSHVVQSGDTLIDIAKRYDLSVSQLMSYNNLPDPDHLVSGQKIWLIAGKAQPSPTKSYKGKTTTYKVQRGDTLIGLANRFGVSAEDIASLNSTLNANDNLVAGQTLTVPIGSSTSAVPSKTRTQTHNIGAGDTLIGVANKYAVSVDELAAANNLDSKARLIAGQTLVIPIGSPVSNKTAPQSFKSSESYKVQSGDSLTALAGRYGVSIETLAAANNLDSKARLVAGQTLNVPKVTTSYTVRSGDGLISLAKRYDMSVEELAKMNGLSVNEGLKIGQKLTVPNR